MGGENVSLIGDSSTCARQTVGAGDWSTATCSSLIGADAGNYQLASTGAATTADITARTLTVSATSANKVYDGTTAATVTLPDNRVAGDAPTASDTAAACAATPAGTATTVRATG